MATRLTRRQRASWALAALCALLALTYGGDTGVHAQGNGATQCSDNCTKFYEACMTRNKKAFADCRAMHKCDDTTKCGANQCKYACATCASQPGYYVTTGCTKALVSCVSTCR